MVRFSRQLEDLFERFILILGSVKMIYKLGEIFAGAGGFAWGAINADIGTGSKIIHAWANDIDKNACKSYRHNICKNDDSKSVICQDVRSLNTNNLDQIDAFAFGFPCNDFSLIGNKSGFNGKYGMLYRYGINIIDRFKPKFFVGENVSNLASINKGIPFETILSDMKSVGYNVFTHIFRFEFYGIPQTRHRLIFVGIRNDYPFEYKPPSTNSFKNIDTSVKSALNNPPIQKDAFNHELPLHTDKFIERLKYIKPGKTAFDSNLPQHLQLKPKKNFYRCKYWRLDPDKPSRTILASWGNPFFHFEQNRTLTNRERARIQSFPDDFKFFGNKSDVQKQIGMAVPPRGAKIIFESILKTFDGIYYESEPCKLSFSKGR